MYITDVSLPQSNSTIAKELRIVKVLAILAELIDKYLFQPTYLLPEDSQFKELLYRLAPKEPEKEKFLRGMMLSILEEEQKTSEAHMINEAMKELFGEDGVEEVVSQTVITEFKQSLRDLLDEAQGVWQDVQHSTYAFISDFDYTQIDGIEWQLFKFETTDTTERAVTSSPVSTQDSDNDLIVLFPRIFILISGEEPRPITTGTVVRKSEIRAMLREERENAQSTEQSVLRSKRKPGRTLSMSTDGPRSGHARGPFLPRVTSPTSRTNG